MNITVYKHLSLLLLDTGKLIKNIFLLASIYQLMYFNIFNTSAGTTVPNYCSRAQCTLYGHCFVGRLNLHSWILVSTTCPRIAKN